MSEFKFSEDEILEVLKVAFQNQYEAYKDVDSNKYDLFNLRNLLFKNNLKNNYECYEFNIRHAIQTYLGKFDCVSLHSHIAIDNDILEIIKADSEMKFIVMNIELCKIFKRFFKGTHFENMFN
jgi:hypothetical protein